jgi:hypothetical protein
LDDFLKLKPPPHTRTEADLIFYADQPLPL